ncbi:hypothetical protein QZH41_003010 [Actinostola sp. cb2023]|nr:hypothetical protein QZH41_003010 [Actinostola sp. cb2023]
MIDSNRSYELMQQIDPKMKTNAKLKRSNVSTWFLFVGIGTEYSKYGMAMSTPVSTWFLFVGIGTEYSKRPSKDCEGPSPPDPSPLVEVVEHEDVSIPPATLSQDPPDVLASILAAVEGLKAQVTTLQKDQADLRASVNTTNNNSAHRVASLGTPTLPSSRGVALPELRQMEGLVQQANDQMADFNLGGDASSDSSSDHEDRRNAGSASSSGKLKSGKEAKLTSSVLYPQLWPHSHLSFTQVNRDVRFEDLTIDEFVAGYGQILLSTRISELEKTARIRHLISLMYLAHQYEWLNVLSFHGAVLLEIERGMLSWSDSFTHLESRTLYGNTKSSSASASSSTTATAVSPALFCRDYQRSSCSNTRDHYGYIRGGPGGLADA